MLQKLLNSKLQLFFLIGVILRLIYWIKTPYNLRAHDASHQLDYIQYVLTNFSIPPANGAFQFYHPPLFYFLSAIYYKFLSIFFDNLDLISSLQFLSLVISVLILYYAVKISKLIFLDQNIQNLFVLIIAVFPGLIIRANAVNNDSLLHLLMFAAFYYSLSWWQNPNLKKWLILSSLIGLGICTKSTMLIFLPYQFFILLLSKNISSNIKWQNLRLALLSILVISAYPVIGRAWHERTSAIVANADLVSLGLKTENTLVNLITFNPIMIFEHPFNNPWNNSAGRKNYLEFYFRSIFFGEYDFRAQTKPLAQAILCIGIISIILFIFGILRRFSNYQEIPLVLISLIALTANFVFRLRYPFICSQDFRYINLLSIPFAYFPLQEIFGMRYLFKHIALGITYLFILLSALLIILV